MADKQWMWRDSLRRLAEGQEIPAFRVNEWSDASAVREKLEERLLTTELLPKVEDRTACRNLALYSLLSAAGDSVISNGGSHMGMLMEELCIDLEWLEEMVYFCPMEHAEAAMPILAYIYHSERRKMAGSPANRRLASAIAFEYASAGLGQEAAKAAYLFYAASGQKRWLNNYFAGLSLWEMRVLAARSTDDEWCKPSTLAWFQRNTRLPAQGYVTLEDVLGARERCLFGEEVGSADFLVLFRDEDGGGAASIYEASGCSTAKDRALYVATAACANGIPALVAFSAKAATCMVDVNGTWELSETMPEGAICTWGYLGQKHPDFVKLVAQLGAEKDRTLASARLAQMGQFLYCAGNKPLAHNYFREAVKVQPLNYAAWSAFHACGGSGAEIAEGAQHFETLPGVAAALRALPASL